MELPWDNCMVIPLTNCHRDVDFLGSGSALNSAYGHSFLWVLALLVVSPHTRYCFFLVAIVGTFPLVLGLHGEVCTWALAYLCVFISLELGLPFSQCEGNSWVLGPHQEKHGLSFLCISI